MLFKIVHRTQYTYQNKILLEPQVLKLFPKSNIYQIVKSFDIKIEPKPYAMSRYVGAMENSVLQVLFDVHTNKFLVQVEFEVETLRNRPFDFFTDPYAQKMKFKYSDKLIHYLLPFLPPNKESDVIKDFAEGLVKESEYDTNLFLIILNKRINSICEYIPSEYGLPNDAEMTLLSKKGCCRDLAYLFVECCRSVGIAARFANGYLYNPKSERNYIHAWAEAYLPGGGWRGYDPVQGLAVGDHHIILSSGATQSDSIPIPDYFRCQNNEFSIDSHISIEQINSQLETPQLKI